MLMQTTTLTREINFKGLVHVAPTAAPPTRVRKETEGSTAWHLDISLDSHAARSLTGTASSTLSHLISKTYASWYGHWQASSAKLLCCSQRHAVAAYIMYRCITPVVAPHVFQQQLTVHPTSLSHNTEHSTSASCVPSAQVPSCNSSMCGPLQLYGSSMASRS